MYQYIDFTACEEWYYPKSVELGILEDSKNYVDHTQINISMGTSRIGGPIIDFPKGEKLPSKMKFAAQLDLKLFSESDIFSLLPKTGFLYFFIGGYGDEGSVFYFDVESKDLERHIVEHESWFWDGCLVDKVSNSTEDFDSRYYEEDGEVEWDYFAGSKSSKIYGIYTHCQKGEEEIKQITESDKILLLQVGENFTDEGVWSVLIDRNDLENKQFENCKFEWGQS